MQQYFCGDGKGLHEADFESGTTTNHTAETHSSSFADLLQQLGQAHDREVAQLRLEIATLTGGQLPPKHTRAEMVIESTPGKTAPNVFADSVLNSSQVTPYFQDAEEEDLEVAHEKFASESEPALVVLASRGSFSSEADSTRTTTSGYEGNVRPSTADLFSALSQEALDQQERFREEKAKRLSQQATADLLSALSEEARDQQRRSREEGGPTLAQQLREQNLSEQNRSSGISFADNNSELGQKKVRVSTLSTAEGDGSLSFSEVTTDVTTADQRKSFTIEAGPCARSSTSESKGTRFSARCSSASRGGSVLASISEHFRGASGASQEATVVACDSEETVPATPLVSTAGSMVTDQSSERRTRFPSGVERTSSIGSSTSGRASGFLSPREINSRRSSQEARSLDMWMKFVSFAKSGSEYVKMHETWHGIADGHAASKCSTHSENVSEYVAHLLMQSQSALSLCGDEGENHYARYSRYSRPSAFDFSTGRYNAIRRDSWFQKWIRLTRRLKTNGNVVLHPNCWARVFWDLSGMILLMHDFVLIPLQVFDSGTGGLGSGYMNFWTDLDFVALIFWTFDICVSFLTGYYSDEGFVEVGHWMIARHYLKTWFPLDFCIVCVDWTGYLLNFDSEVGYLRLGKVISRFLRILRLLRFMKMSEKFNEVLEQINSEYILTLVGVMKLLVGIIMVNHYIACTWYWLSQYMSSTESSWSTMFLKEHEDFDYAYVTSMHWSLTQFTPASMEVHPTNTYERIYTIVVIVGAMVTFSSFVSSITGAMTHLRMINAKKAEQDAAFRQYFSTNKISQELARQVWHFRRRNVVVNKSRMKEADLPSLNFLPSRLREMLRFEVFFPILQPHPLFSLLYDICPSTITSICNQAMSERQVLAGEEMKDVTNPIDRMLFVCHGVLKYILANSDRPVTQGKPIRRFMTQRITNTRKKVSNALHKQGSRSSQRSYLSNPPPMPVAIANKKAKSVDINAGQWACELTLWSSEGRIDGTFCGSETGAELVFLSTAKFRKIAMKHSQTDGAMLMAHYAKLFVQNFNKASVNTSFQNIMFNDPQTVVQILEASTSEMLVQRRNSFEAAMTEGNADAGFEQRNSAGSIDAAGNHVSSSQSIDKIKQRFFAT